MRIMNARMCTHAQALARTSPPTCHPVHLFRPLRSTHALCTVAARCYCYLLYGGCTERRRDTNQVGLQIKVRNDVHVPARAQWDGHNFMSIAVVALPGHLALNPDLPCTAGSSSPDCPFCGGEQGRHTARSCLRSRYTHSVPWRSGPIRDPYRSYKGQCALEEWSCKGPL